MPLFKGTSSKARPQKAIEYITRPEKAAFVDVLNLDEGEDYARAFEATAAYYGKNGSLGERKYYHFKFSAARSDGISPEKHQAAAMELARRLFSDYECVIATHTDTATVHSHIIVNSVSFADGRKLHCDDREYRAMKDLANEVGIEYGMTPLDWRAAKAVKKWELENDMAVEYAEAEKRIVLRGGTSWKEELREVIDYAKAAAFDWTSFEEILNEYGVTFSRDTNKTVSFVHPQKQRAVRGSSLGEGYTKADIMQALELTAEYKPEIHTPDYSELVEYKSLESLLEYLSEFEGIDRVYAENYLTVKEELKLTLRNAAWTASVLGEPLERVLSDADVSIQQGNQDETVYIFNGHEIRGEDLGEQYRCMEVLTNEFGKQNNRQNSRRGIRADEAIRGREKLASFKQAVNAESNGNESADRSVFGELKPSDGNTEKPRQQDASRIDRADGKGNRRHKLSDGRALQGAVGKQPQNGSYGAEHNGDSRQNKQDNREQYKR